MIFLGVMIVMWGLLAYATGYTSARAADLRQANFLQSLVGCGLDATMIEVYKKWDTHMTTTTSNPLDRSVQGSTARRRSE